MSTGYSTTVEAFESEWANGAESWATDYLCRQLGERSDLADLVDRVRSWAIDRIRSGKRTPLNLALHTADLVIRKVQEGSIGPRRATTDVDALIVSLWQSEHNKFVGYIYGLRHSYPSYIRSWQDAEDAAADTFESLRGALLRGDYNGATNLPRLLYGFARNEARRRSRCDYTAPIDPRWQEPDSHPYQIPDPQSPDPLDHLVQQEIVDDVRMVLSADGNDGMSETAIKAALLYWGEGWQIERIAETLGVTWRQAANWKYEAKDRIIAGDTYANYTTD